MRQQSGSGRNTSRTFPISPTCILRKKQIYMAQGEIHPSLWLVVVAMPRGRLRSSTNIRVLRAVLGDRLLQHCRGSDSVMKTLGTGLLLLKEGPEDMLKLQRMTTSPDVEVLRSMAWMTHSNGSFSHCTLNVRVCFALPVLAVYIHMLILCVHKKFPSCFLAVKIQYHTMSPCKK